MPKAVVARELVRLQEHRTTTDDVRLLGRGTFACVDGARRRRLGGPAPPPARVGDAFQAVLPAWGSGVVSASVERGDVRVWPPPFRPAAPPHVVLE